MTCSDAASTLATWPGAFFGAVCILAGAWVLVAFIKHVLN